MFVKKDKLRRVINSYYTNHKGFKIKEFYDFANKKLGLFPSVVVQNSDVPLVNENELPLNQEYALEHILKKIRALGYKIS